MFVLWSWLPSVFCFPPVIAPIRSTSLLEFFDRLAMRFMRSNIPISSPKIFERSVQGRKLPNFLPRSTAPLYRPMDEKLKENIPVT